jgi:hypothetical protein
MLKSHKLGQAFSYTPRLRLRGAAAILHAKKTTPPPPGNPYFVLLRYFGPLLIESLKRINYEMENISIAWCHEFWHSFYYREAGICQWF